MKGFPYSSVGKEFTCGAGDLGSIRGLGRSPGEGKGATHFSPQPHTPFSENAHCPLPPVRFALANAALLATAGWLSSR